MRSDNNGSELMPLTKASRLLTDKPHPNTLRRWILKGVRNRKLEGTLVGGRWHVTEEALNKFL